MDHSEPLFLDLKILNIYKINDYLCSIFMYRFNYYQNNLPDFYCGYFKQNNELHNYNTGSALHFLIRSFRFKYENRSGVWRIKCRITQFLSTQ